MPDLGPHAVYIVSAYIGVTLVTAALIFGTLMRANAIKRRLSHLEQDQAGSSQ